MDGWMRIIVRVGVHANCQLMFLALHIIDPRVLWLLYTDVSVCGSQLLMVNVIYKYSDNNQNGRDRTKLFYFIYWAEAKLCCKPCWHAWTCMRRHQNFAARRGCFLVAITIYTHIRTAKGLQCKDQNFVACTRSTVAHKLEHACSTAYIMYICL